MKQLCEELFSPGNRSPFLLAFLVDMCEESVHRCDGDEAYSVDRAVQVLSCSIKDFISSVILCIWN
jgi:hypothetical protein